MLLQEHQAEKRHQSFFIEMNRIIESCMQEDYLAPVCDILSLESQVICQTSLTGGDIKPGEGFDWGTL